MKRCKFYGWVLSLIVGATLFSMCGGESQLSQAHGLRIDYIRLAELTEIRSKRPIFSWELPQQSVSQSSYQIIVTTADDLNQIVWDSSRVESDNSSVVEYGGEPLRPGEHYIWKVRFWDHRNMMSEYSEPQRFKMSDSDSSSIVTDNPILERYDRHVKVKRMEQDVLQYDFGKAAFGSLTLEMVATGVDTLAIRVGEQLDSLGRINVEPAGYSVYYQEALIVTDPSKSRYKVDMVVNKRNTGPMAIHLPDSLGVIFPFRYVEVCRLSPKDSVGITPIRRVTYGYRDEELSSFHSSNALLNDIWELCRYTIQATDLFGCYIDGERERIPYEADAYLNQLSHYCVDAEYAIAKKTLEYFMSHATWPTEWLLHTPMIAYQDYMYTGDTRLLTQYYEMLKMKSLHELSREDGLISSTTGIIDADYMLRLGYAPGSKEVEDIVDWPPASFSADGIGERDGHEMMPYNTAVNCFFYHTMTIMSHIANVVGRDADAKMFADRAAKVRVAINDKLFDQNRGIYIDGEGSTHSSLHSNMYALAFDIVPSDRVQGVVDYVKSRGLVCSVYGAQYLLEALYKAGEDQYALDIMTNTSIRSWYNMIRIGSTMTLEAWDSFYKLNLDWNHAWGAAPANIIPRMMWGVTPTSPAYQSATIKPQLADLTESSISIPTILGAIVCDYKLVDGVKYYNVDIPANMDVTFNLGRDHQREIKYDGAYTANDNPLIQLHVGRNSIEVR